MKQIKFLKHITLFIFLMFVAIGHTQGNSGANDLLGTWVFQVPQSIDKMASDIKNELSTSSDLQSHVQSFYSGRQMYFGANGTASILLATGQQFTGQWQVQGNLLNIIEANGATTTYEIGGLTNTNLLLLAPPDISTENRQLFPELYFSKLQ